MAVELTDTIRAPSMSAQTVWYGATESHARLLSTQVSGRPKTPIGWASC